LIHNIFSTTIRHQQHKGTKRLLWLFTFSCVTCPRFELTLKLTQTKWASDMIESVSKTSKIMEGIIDYIQIISRRSSGGLSSLCKILPCALPIASEYIVFVLSDCMLTGLKNRPCFNIVWGKHGEQTFSAHHSHLESCQSLWSIMHLDDIFIQFVQSFQKKRGCYEVLTDLINEFCTSNDFDIIKSYVLFVINDCYIILNEDNSIEFQSKI